MTTTHHNVTSGQGPDGRRPPCVRWPVDGLVEIDLRHGWHNRAEAEQLIRRQRSSRFAAPHRVASWSLATFTLVALACTAAAWSIAFVGRWTALSEIAALVTFLILVANGFFRVNMAEGGRFRLRLATVATTFGVVTSLLVASGAGLDQPGSRAFILLMVAFTAAAVLSRLAGRAALEALWRAGHLRASALVLGYDNLSQELAVEIALRRSCGVNVVGLVADAPLPRDRPSLGLPVFRVDSTNRRALVTQLAWAVQTTEADRLIIGPLGSIHEETAMVAARWAGAQRMPVHVVPRLHQLGMGLDSMWPDRVRGYPLVRMQRSAHPTLSFKLKRLLDITVAATALVLTLPLMAVAAVAVKLSGPGPILYTQARVGQGGRIISINKFRSMTHDGDGTTEWTSDARITPVGHWLRRTNIDELPQLLSVLRGDMSLVGPRPERPVFVARYRRAIPDYDDRHRAPVGLTGLAQVVGLRGNTSIAERVKYDNLYIDQWSLRSDISILAQTLTAIVFQHRRSREMIDLDEKLGALWK